MIFTAGNIITLVISLLVIITLRQRDKSNRTLDLVKKYGTHLKQDLDDFTHQKLDDIEQKSIDLDVHHKTAVAAIKRLDEIHSQIMGRTADMSKIGEQISRYDEVLRELLDMTDRAQQSMTALKNEAEFSEKLAQKLHSAESQLSKIESAIPELRKDFTASNEQSLSVVRQNIEDSFADTIAEINNRIETVKQRAEALTTDAVRNLESQKDAYNDQLMQMSAVSESQTAKLREAFDTVFSTAATQAATLEHDAFTKLKNQATERLTAYKEQVESKCRDLSDHIKTEMASVQQNATAVKTECTVGIKELTDRWATDKTALLQSLQECTDTANQKIETIQSQWNTFTNSIDTAWQQQSDARIASYKEELDVKCDELSDFVKAEMASIQQNADLVKAEYTNTINDLSTTWANTKSTLSEGMQECTRMNSEQINSLQEKWDSFTGNIELAWKRQEEDIQSFITRRESELRQRLDEFKSRADDAIASASKTADLKVLDAVQAIDGNLNSYKDDIAYRFETIDMSLKDIDRVEQDLRTVLDQTANKVSSDFMIFVNEQISKHQAFETDFTHKFGSLDDKISALDTELSQLKQQAALNVSQKLKLFEDDFAKDLAARNEKITAELDSWKETVSRKMTELSEATGEQTKEAEKTLSETLHSELTIVQEHYHEQHLRIDNQIKNSAETMQSQIQGIEEQIEKFHEQYREELGVARRAAESALQNEISLHAQSVEEYLKNQEKEINSQILALTKSVQDAQSGAESGISETKDVFTSWRVRFNQQFDDSKEELDRKFASITDTAVEQKRQITEQTAQLEEKIRDLQTTLATQQKESIEAFRASYNEMLDDTGSKIRENTTEADEKIREMRTLLQDIRTQMETSRDLMLGKIETQASRLQNNLDIIEKRQKEFISQTKIFDRADALKKELETNIASMKDDVKRIDDFNLSLEKISRDQDRIKRQEDETSQKVAKFLAERKRIDEIDGKFNQIMSLSSMMDGKLSEFTANSDLLQQFQLQIKRCQDGVGDMQQKYDRLDSKSKILDQTVEEIDKAFEYLTELEKKAGLLQETIHSLPDEVTEFRHNLDVLLANKEKAEAAATKIETLEDYMADVESRMDKLQKAREWIAGTETRLTSISKQAKDEVKLMGDLLKNDSATKKTTGAPTISQRENIKKLAAMGWGADKIASKMELSQGEVELILEMISDT